MIGKLLESAREHATVVQRTAELAKDVLGNGSIAVKRPNPHTPAYLQKNFFSILFLSVYRSIGVPRERRLIYGMVNRCLRGIVTAADNLLDEEYKDILGLRGLPEEATTYKSVLQILIFDRVLALVVRRAVDDGHLPAEEAEDVLNLLLRKLAAIGAEEAEEEAGVRHILAPDEIIRSVHRRKGADLLKLSLVAPLMMENGLSTKLRLCETGIHEIGIGLQVLDDAVDFCEDIRRKNHNYFVSTVFHEGDASERILLDRLLADPGSEETASVLRSGGSMTEVVNRAVEHAEEGFSVLGEAGHWLSNGHAIRLIEMLFKARGLVRLWSMVR